MRICAIFFCSKIIQNIYIDPVKSIKYFCTVLDKISFYHKPLVVNQDKSFLTFLSSIFWKAIKFPWIINWILYGILIIIVLLFQSREVPTIVLFDFFYFDNQPNSLINFVLQQLLFTVCLFCISFGLGIRLPQISKLVALFSFVIVISLFYFLFPIINLVFFP
jgi:hypothetical protein